MGIAPLPPLLGLAGVVAAEADDLAPLAGDRHDADGVAALLQTAQVDDRPQAPAGPADLHALAGHVDLRRLQALALRRAQADAEAPPADALAVGGQLHAGGSRLLDRRRPAAARRGRRGRIGRARAVAGP